MSNKLKAVAKGIAEVGKKLKSKSARSGRRGRRRQKEDAIAKGVIGTTGAAATGILGGNIVLDKRRTKERQSLRKTKFENMKIAAKKAKAAGKKTFTYQGKEYSVNPNLYYFPLAKKAGGGIMTKKGFANGGSAQSKTQSRGNFPDLTGDGKVTKKDVLRGRGVPGFKKGGSAKKKGLGTKWESKWG